MMTNEQRQETLKRLMRLEHAGKIDIRRHFKALHERYVYLQDKIDRNDCSHGSYSYLVGEKNALKWVLDLMDDVLHS